MLCQECARIINFDSGMMNKYFENFNRNDLYAIQGPHLSPKGYKLVADKINKYISK